MEDFGLIFSTKVNKETGKKMKMSWLSYYDGKYSRWDK